MTNLSIPFAQTLRVAALVAIAAAGLTLAGTGAHAATPDQVRRIVIEEASRNATVPTSLALAVARVESNFRDTAESAAGARGVMQIMPATARGEFGVAADRLWDARTNARLGILYLERLYRQYGGRWDLALSHYNGGTLKGRGASAIAHSYTRGYVRNVLAWNARFQRQHAEAVLVATNDATIDTNDYWLADDRGLDHSWREYLRIAERWMAVSQGAAPQPEPVTQSREFAPTPVLGHTSVTPSTAQQVRRLTELQRSIDDLGQRFRNSLNTAPRTTGLRFGG